MTNPLSSPSGAARFLRPLFLLALGLCLVLPGSAAEPVKRSFSVPADDAVRALKQFAAQSGEQLLYSPSDVAGVKTLAVNGTLSAREALEKMLEGTALVVAQDKATGALAVRRETPGEAKNVASRPAEAKAAGGRFRDGVMELDKYEVTAPRPGIINVGVLGRDEDSPFQHVVYTREQIEQLGMSSVEDLMMQITGASNYQTGLQSAAEGTNITGGQPNRYSTLSLRGFDASQTVILVNGRKLSTNPITFGTLGAVNIGRISLAAIERIEVMPLSGSAIYGAGAMGGAINIILRKDYTRREVTALLGTSTGGGASEYRLTYEHGLSFNNRKTSGMVILDFHRREALRGSQRDYLDRLLERVSPVGSADFFSLAMTHFSGSPGVIRSTVPLGIPGAPDATYATLPAGQNGTGLTPASFAATAGQISLGGRSGDQILSSPMDKATFNLQLEHEFLPRERLTGYTEVEVVTDRSDYTYPSNRRQISLSATDNINPFPGKAVTVYFDSPDLPLARHEQQKDYARALLGLKGRVLDTWYWALDVQGDYNRSYSLSNNPGDYISILLQGSASRPAAERLAIYNPFADARRFPVSQATIDKWLVSTRMGAHYNYFSRANFRVNGTLWDLPAGPLAASVRAESELRHTRMKDQSVRTPDANVFAGADRGLLDRTTTSTYNLGGAELSIPVISERWRPIPIHAMRFEGAQSRTWSNEDKQPADVSALAGQVSLTKDVMFRYSLSDGFSPPDVFVLAAARIESVRNANYAVDPKRGNTRNTAAFTSVSGGNPDLRPEVTEASNWGVVLTPRWVPGLRLGVDVSQITKTDRIEFPDVQQILDFEDSYPGRVTRAAPTPADVAAGWAGEIAYVDATRVNVGREVVRSIDMTAGYSLPTRSHGTFQFNGKATRTTRWTRQQLPGSPVLNFVNSDLAPNRLRGYASLFWTKDRLTLGATARYVGWYLTRDTAPSAAYPAASGYDGPRVPESLLFDLQASYEIPPSSGPGGWRKWLAGTRFTVTCQNIADRMPAYRTDFSSFYSRLENPRQRFVQLQIRKSL